MFENPKVIPITVTVAILIFLAREVLETVRRRSSNRRKLIAIRNQIAAECERNNWAIRWIRQAVIDLRSALEDGCKITVKTTSIGVRRLTFLRDTGESSSPIPRAYSVALDKYLFEAASLDADLFSKMVEASAGIAELNHILDGLVDHALDPDQQWLDGWTYYATRETAESEEPILYLYEACTGNALTKTRLR